MLMCSEPDLEISQCAAQIYVLGASPQVGSRGRAVRNLSNKKFLPKWDLQAYNHATLRHVK